jgi:hypothetical protein
MYSLSLAADDNASFFTEARQAVAARLGIAAAPDPRIEEVKSRFATAMEELLSLRPHQAGEQPLELFMRLGSRVTVKSAARATHASTSTSAPRVALVGDCKTVLISRRCCNLALPK